jgi:hypothetical protein
MGSAGRHDISTFLGLLDGATHMPLLNPWACFLDESGKFQDTEIVSIGVCVIRAEEVQPLTEKWASVLERNNLPFTSMKEAVNFKGPYFDWKSNPGKRDEVLRALAQVLIDARIGCLAGTAPSARFDTL